MADGAAFPALTVFLDDAGVHWLADGFHRYHAADRLGWHRIEADVRQGERRDALLHAAGANATHGLRRSNDDKRRSVLLLLADPEWSRWSDGRIAQQCSVGETLVRTVRAEISPRRAEISPTTRLVERNGTTYRMDTTRIGARGENRIPENGWWTAADRREADDAEAGALMQRVLEEDRSDVEVRQREVVARFARAVFAFDAALVVLDPEEVADASAWTAPTDPVHQQGERIARWLERFAAARGRGLRLVAQEVEDG